MRTYLAMQAMESGKGLGGPLFARTGLVPYGQGNMLLGAEQGGQGKVCKSLLDISFLFFFFPSDLAQFTYRKAYYNVPDAIPPSSPHHMDLKT